MDVVSRLPEIRGEYRFDLALSKFCWFQIGGTAKVLYKPADAEDLSNFIRNLPSDIPYFVFGVGSNLLISDKGFNGVAIRLGRHFNYLEFGQDNRVKSGTTMLDLNLALATADHGIGGLEFFAGIPGTIGGAIAMNAGAYGKETKDVLISTKAIREDGEIVEISVEDMGYRYRGQSLTKRHIFLEATFQGTKEDASVVKQRIVEIQDKRAHTQPIKTKTGGSTFKNPEGYKAWQLIDKAGCRGLSIGDAQVSEMHCNFFINKGNASANDMISLINTVKDRVYRHSGVMLEEEIKIIEA
ncbi:MAG: UDP-N-acetylmuramate dehydrogenase [Alphaproteobacteria bacterium]|jgi:UDP-N-acetylmuramate dehydrogenase|nr:UDP-N-acetylmuramate dehydrogenase [Candidatus Jidaibacter sp.]